MLEQAQRSGFITGNSLRQGNDTHAGSWQHYCRQCRIPYIVLSHGRHRSRVELGLYTIDPDLFFHDAADLYVELIGAVNDARDRAMHADRIVQRDGGNWIEVEGLTHAGGERLARHFASIVGWFLRDLTHLPDNVISLQEFRRMRTYRKGQSA